MKIDSNYGVPEEDISCPACGRKYGYHKTKVCSVCEECSNCCMCLLPRPMDAREFIRSVIDKLDEE